MTKSLVYLAPIALIGLMATPESTVASTWSGSMARNIAATTAERTETPLVLVQRGGRGGGGARAGGAAAGGARGGAVAGGGGWGGVSGGSRAGVSSANINRSASANVNRSANVNVNRNVNVEGGYYRPGWGGVAAGVAVGAAVGAAAASTPAPYTYCPYPTLPNCGL